MSIFKTPFQNEASLNLVFAKPEATRTRHKSDGVFVSTQKDDTGARLCVALTKEFVDQFRLRDGDRFQVAFQNDTVYLLPDKIGYKLSLTKNSKKLRVYCPIKSEWDLLPPYRATMSECGANSNGMITIKLEVSKTR